MMSAVPQRFAANFDLQSAQEMIRVLLIDDHALVAETLRAIFDPHDDIEFFYCSDPSSALKVANRIRPTVVLLDLIMPDLTGLELVRDFRVTPSLTDVPIVMLSAKEDAVAKEETFAAGANDYLVKLPDQIEIVARVRYHSRAYTQYRVLQDTVAQLKKAHSQLLQSERMASVGLLAAGVAHEINNPIAFVTSNFNSLHEYYQDVFAVIDAYTKLDEAPSVGSADLEPIVALKEQLQLDVVKQDIEQIFEECTEGLSRVRKIVDDLKGFSRSDNAEMQWTDLHDELDGTLNIANNEIKYKADVNRKYGDLPKVECIPSQINQVFLNLLVNAAQSIEGRGSISIETTVATIPEEFAAQDNDHTGDAEENFWISVRISDTGRGIDPESMRHIFDPFFTTKEAGKGTGLGLSLSYEIVQRHGGHLGVESEIGKGTTFSVWLPIRQSSK